MKEGNEEDPWPKYNDPDRAKASKAVFEIEPLEAGAAYIEWSMTDDKGTAKAYSKVMVKKPVSTVSVNYLDEGVLVGGSDSETPAMITGLTGALESSPYAAGLRGSSLHTFGVVWKVIDPETGEEKDAVKGIKPVPDEKDGCRCKVLIDPSASPGCYVIEAKAEGTGYNTVYCDVTVK